MAIYIMLVIMPSYFIYLFLLNLVMCYRDKRKLSNTCVIVDTFYGVFIAILRTCLSSVVEGTH